MTAHRTVKATPSGPDRTSASVETWQVLPSSATCPLHSVSDLQPVVHTFPAFLPLFIHSAIHAFCSPHRRALALCSDAGGTAAVRSRSSDWTRAHRRSGRWHLRWGGGDVLWPTERLPGVGMAPCCNQTTQEAGKRFIFQEVLQTVVFLQLLTSATSLSSFTR